MNFKSDSQRRAVFANMSKFSGKNYDVVSLYHGTTDKMLEEKIMGKKMQERGPTLFFTSNPGVAGIYAREASKKGFAWEDNLGISDIYKREHRSVSGGIPVVVEVEIPYSELASYNVRALEDSSEKRNRFGEGLPSTSAVIYDEIMFNSVPTKYIKDVHVLGKDEGYFSEYPRYISIEEDSL